MRFVAVIMFLSLFCFYVEGKNKRTFIIPGIASENIFVTWNESTDGFTISDYKYASLLTFCSVGEVFEVCF